MNTNRVFRSLILGLLLFFGSTNSGFAHDPGLSRTVVQLFDSEIAVSMSLSPTDFRAAFPEFLNQGGREQSDRVATQSELKDLAYRTVDIRNKVQSMAARSVSVSVAPEDAVNIDLVYPRPAMASVSVHVPLIAMLARGHRQHLTVLDQQGEEQSPHILDAKSLPISLQPQSRAWTVVLHEYIEQGVWHIWIGFDHILFLVTLLLPAVLVYRRAQWQSAPNLRIALVDTLKIVTAFTLAHSITLTLAVLEIAELPGWLVEPAIAVSVIIAAIHNLRPQFANQRWVLAFAFGLIHGFGFANVLVDLGLSESTLALSLAGFNIGVELGQLTIVALVFPLAYYVRRTRLYQKWLFNGGSVAAAGVGAIWMVERVFA